MTELRRRGGGGDTDNSDNISDKADGEERLAEPKAETPDVPPTSENTPNCLNKALEGLPPRWKNYWIRGVLSLAMISGFFLIIYLGPITLILVVMTVQIKCFQEIITIGYRVYHSYELPWFRTLSWYFLVCVNYFFYGETVADYFGALVQREEPLQFLARYHRFISFALYLAGFCMFVLSLVKKHYRLQFYMFAWTHVTLLIVVTQSHLVIQNLFEGMIWFIVPISIVICNDIMAYLFGFFFGRTPLIKLAYLLAQFQYFVCPVGYNSETYRFTVVCEPSDLFILQEYTLPAETLQLYPFQIHSIFLSSFASLIGPFGGFFASGFKRAFKIKFAWTHVTLLIVVTQSHLVIQNLFEGMIWFIVPISNPVSEEDETLQLYPFQIHSIFLSSFASLIGPFGGFFASGFKRAFKIKDFADTIPGHGGIMDRFDCQGPNPSKVLQQLLVLQPEQQLSIFHTLSSHLRERGMLPPAGL
ncbi:hypothetical protein CRUP_007503 [Coryphaenoides rupestris]|nr:hypothetical protein CRUP_007503 [Coryphaenoides rupestris]